jgi:hypothetical protein
VTMLDVLTGSQSIGLSPSTYAITITDSGTSGIILAQAAWNVVSNRLTDACTAAGNTCTSCKTLLRSGFNCVSTSLPVFGVLPNVTLSFSGGASLVLDPRMYFQPCSGNASSYRLVLQPYPGAATYIGGYAMMYYRVAHDLKQQRLGFAPGNQCAGWVPFPSVPPSGPVTPQQPCGAAILAAGLLLLLVALV